jgi:type I restriction enzyme R subunit
MKRTGPKAPTSVIIYLRPSPKATRIAFTGPPLITEQNGTKWAVKRFIREYIDTYELMDAVHDGATLQIHYEGRTADGFEG